MATVTGTYVSPSIANKVINPAKKNRLAVANAVGRHYPNLPASVQSELISQEIVTTSVATALSVTVAGAAAAIATGGAAAVAAASAMTGVGAVAGGAAAGASSSAAGTAASAAEAVAATSSSAASGGAVSSTQSGGPSTVGSVLTLCLARTKRGSQNDAVKQFFLKVLLDLT